MATQVEELRNKLQEATKARREFATQFNAEHIPSDEDEAKLDAFMNAEADLQEDVTRAEKFARAQASNGSRPVDDANPAKSTSWPTREPNKSIGQRFAEWEPYKAWLHNVAPTGVIPDSSKGLHSPPMPFKGLTELQMMAALITGVSDTSAGAMVRNAYYPEITELGRRPLTIRDVVTNLQTGSDTVEFVRITQETNAAAPTAEATATSGASGVKPESTLAFEKVSTIVRTIAHWIPATKRSLSDAAQLRGLIDAFLRYGLEEELEDQMVTGNSAGENFTGILNTSGRQSQAYDTSLLKTTRVARRKVQTVGRRRPNAFILHPIDWESIDLLQDAENRYYMGGPRDILTPRLWGLPVIESEAVTQGIGLVGDFATCVLWDREDASISVSDSHSDFFIRNLIAILAELRAAFGVLKPNALVEIDLTA